MVLDQQSTHTHTHCFRPCCPFTVMCTEHPCLRRQFDSFGLCFSTASPPDFSRSQLRSLLKAKTGSTVTMECRPQAFPTAVSLWRKGNEALQSTERYNLFLFLNSSYPFLLTVYSCKASPQGPCYVHTFSVQAAT